MVYSYPNESYTRTVHLYHLSVITKSFEELFNIKLGDCYKKHESVISRKSTKLTDFLDELRKFIIEERENKGYR